MEKTVERPTVVVRVAPSSPVTVLTTGTVVTGVLLLLPEDVSPSDSVLLLLLSSPEVEVEVKVEDTVAVVLSSDETVVIFVVVSLPVVVPVVVEGVSVAVARVVVGPSEEKMLRAARLVEGVVPPAAEAAEASAGFLFSSLFFSSSYFGLGEWG